MSASPRSAMAPGSVSLRLYPHLELGPEGAVAELLRQARRAEEAGLDGIMVSEHHNGFAGYLPNPVQVAGWLLEATAHAWAAPCPVLLPLRPAALVAEETAWMAARFPGRVGLGVAAGSLEADFTVMGLAKDAAVASFPAALTALAGMLGGRDPGPLPADSAVARCATAPVPLVSAAMSPAAVRRAAGVGVGLLFDSLTTVDRCRQLADRYRAEHGTGPVVLIRRAWVGEPPTALQERQVQVYRSYAAANAMTNWGDDQAAIAPDAAGVADILLDQAQAVGADSLNVRVHTPGIPPDAVRDQIDVLGDVRAALGKRWTGSGPSSEPRRPGLSPTGL